MVWGALLIAQSLGHGLPELLTNLTAALQHPLEIRWTDKSLLSILICTGLYIMGLCVYASEQRRTRDGEEHGSAAWGSPRQVNTMFRQKKNKILTRHVRLGLDTHKHRRSLNVLVIGGSGAAKTRSYVKPNILEANTNYVITDPKSEVLLATGGYLKSKGYDIRVLNLVNLEQSDGYNPFRYLRDEKDALKLVNNLIQATTPKGSHESDPFWTKAETALLQAIILMLFQEAPEYEQNFSMVMRVLEYAEVREEDDEYLSPLDLLFQAMEREDPESVALRQYKVFKQSAGKTAKSILVSAAVRLAPFNLPQIPSAHLEIGGVGTRLALGLPMSLCIDGGLAQCLGNVFMCAGLVAAQVEDGIRVAGDCLPGVLVQLLDLGHVLDDGTGRNVSGAHGGQFAGEAGQRHGGKFVQHEMDVLGQSAVVDLIRTVIERLECLGVEERHQKIKGVVIVWDHCVKGAFLFSQSIEVHIVVIRDGPELLTPDEVRALDNRYCILFIRGAKPVMDLKYELTEHPAIRHTVDGGGTSYIHHGHNTTPAIPGTPFFQVISADEANKEKETAA